MIKSILRKSTGQKQVGNPSSSGGHQYNGAYLDAERFDGAHMTEEAIVDHLGEERVAVSFAANAGPRLI